MEKVKRIGIKDIVPNKLGTLSVIGMFYATCCAGAFGVEEMIFECGPGFTILLLAAIPLVWALPYCLICAEMSSARPVEGGKIMWVKEALGEFWFAIMVFLNFLWGLVANTVYVVLAVSYLGSIVPMTPFMSFSIKLGLVLLFFLVNILGLKEVSILSTVLSFLIVAVFALVAIVGFANWNENPVTPFFSGEYSGVFGYIGTGMAIGIWMYSGFDEVSLMAGEIKNSKRIIPRAILLVIPLMMLTYILPTLGGLASIGNWHMWTTEAGGFGYYTVLNNFLGPVFGVIFVIVAVLGQCTIFNVCITAASRSALVLSDQNWGPKILAKLTSKKGSPYMALAVVAMVSILLLPFDFTFLVVIDAFFGIGVCILTTIAAFVLRRRIPEGEFSFKIPGGMKIHTFLCVLVLCICTAVLLVDGTDYFLGGLVAVMLLPVFYYVSKRVYKGASVMEADIYPINPKTHIGFGDLNKMGMFYLFVGIFASLSRFFLQFYEGSWANEYYQETYESGIFSSFSDMLSAISILGAAALLIGIVILSFAACIDNVRTPVVPSLKADRNS
jgi:amino acid transporter